MRGQPAPTPGSEPVGDARSNLRLVEGIAAQQPPEPPSFRPEGEAPPQPHVEPDAGHKREAGFCAIGWSPSGQPRTTS